MRRSSESIFWLLASGSGLLLTADTGGLTALPATLAGTNVLSSANSGFETGHGWTGLNGTTIKVGTTMPRSGSHSLEISDTGAGVGPSLAVASSYKVGRIRFWVRTAGTVPGSGAWIYVYLFDGTHGATAFACGRSDYNGAPINGLSLNGGLADWTQYTGCDEVTLSELHYGDTLTYRILVKGLPSGATVYVDDVEIAPVL